MWAYLPFVGFGFACTLFGIVIGMWICARPVEDRYFILSSQNELIPMTEEEFACVRDGMSAIRRTGRAI